VEITYQNLYKARRGGYAKRKIGLGQQVVSIGGSWCLSGARKRQLCKWDIGGDEQAHGYNRR
jgi:hypothetical protein